jgi:hypothetical protein
VVEAAGEGEVGDKFETDCGAKFPKAVAKIVDDVEALLTFFDFPAEHWVHLRTTNPIESTFATVRNRSKITKGPGSRAAGIAMAYKLIEAAQSRWQRHERATPGRARAGRRPLRERPTRRTTRRAGRRQDPKEVRRLKARAAAALLGRTINGKAVPKL